MKSFALHFLLFCLLIPCILTSPSAIASESKTPIEAGIIPRPASLHWSEGKFALAEQTAIVCPDPVVKGEAEMLASWLRPATGFALPIIAASDAGDIRLTLDPAAEPKLGREGYTLSVTSKDVQITAAAPAGLFYGGQTLRQLLPPSIFAQTKQAGVSWEIPRCRIEDRPRFGWRGLMLDSSRHFQTPEDIKRWLDLLAMHKLNVFHWHLVDDHGWRFESKKYPLLTQIGAWREQPPIGRYGGFYTQQEMRDIVAYAGQRHITIVPEIEMPGHSRAALAAYPTLACGDVKTIVDHFYDFPMRATTFPPIPGSNVFCAGKEQTYQFIEDVLTEVMDIFPSQYIHVGGDEVNMASWKKCPDCQATMKRLHLANGQQLQAHFMGRIEKFLIAHGRKLIGWDEILEGGLSPSATVMSWRGTEGGTQAAKTGHDAVMSPSTPLYFDHRQSAVPQHPPGFGARVGTLREVYDYEPVPKGFSPEEARHILGAQANLWSCATDTRERLELFAFPRLCALAEIAWSPPAGKDYEQFRKRLDDHNRRLDIVGVNYWRDIEANHYPIGGWSPNPALKDGTTFELPIEQALAPGAWTVTFTYQKGHDALRMDAVELLADQTVVAGDIHEGTAGSQHIRNEYTLVVPELQAGAKLSLRTKAHVTPYAKGGNGDTAGVITMSQITTVRLFAPELPLPPIRATTPDTQDRDHAVYDWAARHQQVLDQLKTAQPEIVIIGDSITHYWAGEPAAPIARAPEAWKQAFGDRAVANLGFGWDRTENVLWRIDHGELDGITPKEVILLIGTNNLEFDTPEEVLAGIDAICRRVHAKLPAARILLLGILPRKDQASLKSDLDKVNYLLETHLHPRGYVNVLDLGNQFRHPDGSFNDKVFTDGLHPNKEGYAILAENLKASLDKTASR